MTLFKNLTAALLVTAVAAPVMAADWDFADKDNRQALRLAVRGTAEGQFGALQERDYSKRATWEALGVARKDGTTWTVTVDADHLKTYLTSKRSGASKANANGKLVNNFLKAVYGNILNRFGGDAAAAVAFMSGKPAIVVEIAAAGVDTALTPASLEAVQAATAAIAPKPKYNAALEGWIAATGPLAAKGQFVKGDAVDTVLTAKQLADEGLTDLSTIRRVGRSDGKVAHKPFETFEDLSARRKPQVGLRKALIAAGVAEDRVDASMKDYKFLKSLPIGGDASLGVVSAFVEADGDDALTDSTGVGRYVQSLKDQNAALALRLQDMQKLVDALQLQVSQGPKDLLPPPASDVPYTAQSFAADLGMALKGIPSLSGMAGELTGLAKTNPLDARARLAEAIAQAQPKPTVSSHASSGGWDDWQ